MIRWSMLMAMEDNSTSSDRSSTSSTIVTTSTTTDATINRTTSWTEINFNDLKIQQTIGRGTYGQVSLALWKNSRVAVKIMETDAEKKAFSIEVWFRYVICCKHKCIQLKHLHRVKHPNIVTLYGACMRPKACLVMGMCVLLCEFTVCFAELMECGSMHDRKCVCVS